jgi:hypothetical protein
MRTLALGGLALLGGCAQLNVDVDVMEPRYASAAALDAGLRIEAANIAATPHGLSDIFVARAFSRYRQYRDECIDELTALATRLKDSQDALTAQVYQQNIEQLRVAKNDPALIGEIAASRERARRNLYAADNAVLNAVGGESAAALAAHTPTPISVNLRGRLLARRAAVAAVETMLREQMRGQAAGGFSCQTAANRFASNGTPPPEIVQAAQAKTEGAAQDVAQIARQATITGEGTLLNNNLEAFYITNAPDRMWARRYNRAFGGGMFGSTSVAIVMNDTADFSVKGFIFDGRSVAQMVSKVGVQAIATIAAAHGAPINLRSTPSSTGSPTSFDTAQLISTNRATVERAEAEEEAYQSALLRIAESVMSNWAGLTAPTEDAAARNIVSGTLSAYRSSWQAPAQPPRQ